MDALETHLTTPIAELAQSSRSAPFDAVVIGGGTSGVVSAVTLAERGARVALLEAGPLLLLTNVNSTDLRFETAQVSQLRQRVEYTSTHGSGAPYGPLISCLGGRGMFWGGSTPRMQRADFAAWPISDEDLDYAWAERQLLVNHEYADSPLAQSLLRTLQRASIDARVLPVALDGGRTENGALRGTLGNAVTILLRSRLLWRAQNPIRLATNVIGARLLIAGNTVSGVEVLDRSAGAKHELHARSVVLAAGAFESTRLAMVSEVPDRSGRLGRGVVDHLFSRTNFQIPLHWYDAKQREIAMLHVADRDARGFQLEIHAPTGMLFSGGDSVAWKPELSREYAAMVRGFGVVDPRPENRIEPLTGDGPGRFTVHLEYGPVELARRDAMRAEITRVGELLGAPSAPIEDLAPGRSYHEAGGLAMARTPSEGVTDPGGRFHACPNLVAADAAAWPTLAAANPHLTIAAHARRVALHLATELTKT